MVDMKENVSVSYFKSLIYCISIITVTVIISEQEAPFLSFISHLCTLHCVVCRYFVVFHFQTSAVYHVTQVAASPCFNDNDNYSA